MHTTPDNLSALDSTSPYDLPDLFQGEDANGGALEKKKSRSQREGVKGQEPHPSYKMTELGQPHDSRIPYCVNRRAKSESNTIRCLTNDSVSRIVEPAISKRLKQTGTKRVLPLAIPRDEQAVNGQDLTSSSLSPSSSSLSSSPATIKEEKVEITSASPLKNRTSRQLPVDSPLLSKGSTKHHQRSSSPARNIRISAVKEPPRVPDVIHSDTLLKEMKWMHECFVTEHKTKSKAFKAVVQQSIKFLSGREGRFQKQREEEAKRLRASAKSMALGVREFWRVIDSLVSQQLQTKVKGELRKQKVAKQTELVEEATKMAEAIAKGLRSWDSGVDPLMIRTAETEKYFTGKGRRATGLVEAGTEHQTVDAIGKIASQPEPESPDDVRSEGWSEQEEEDAELDEELSDEGSASSEGSEDELAALQREMAMDLDALKAKFHVDEAAHVLVPTSDESPLVGPRKRRRRSVLRDEGVDNEAGSKEDPCVPTLRSGHDQEEKTSMESLRIPRKKRRLDPDNQESMSHGGSDHSLCLPARDGEIAYRTAEPSEAKPDHRVSPSRYGQRAATSTDVHASSDKVETENSRTGPRATRCRERQLHSSCPDGHEPDAPTADLASDALQNPSDSGVNRLPGLCTVPFLLRAELRPYQHEGLTWLLTLHDNQANGILADEMGLGKTIQTIACLAYLACCRGIWGPHLIVAPSSVILNWETEFKRFLPGFKVLTYYGGRKEREKRRMGWSEPFAFHVCIVSYSLVVADAHVFRRKAWYYMVLDEAHNIKNFKTQKWQTMLNFNSQRRLLLTGTPLQNDLTELWALMHFLMPDLFESHSDWKELFNDPLIRALETDSVECELGLVDRLHIILRPFLLRRLKREVEGQMPSKFEHVVKCCLTKRQKLLYDELIESKTTKATMESSDYFGLLNILMQLRKVCNHPDLMGPREVSTPFGDEAIVRPSLTVPSCTVLSLHEPWTRTPEQLEEKLSLESSLTALAANEIHGAPDYRESIRDLPAEPAVFGKSLRRRGACKDLEMSARGIARFPIVQIIAESSTEEPRSLQDTAAHGQQQRPFPLPATTSQQLRPIEGGCSTFFNSQQLTGHHCDCCGLVSQLLLTPVSSESVYKALTPAAPRTSGADEDRDEAISCIETRGFKQQPGVGTAFVSGPIGSSAHMTARLELQHDPQQPQQVQSLEPTAKRRKLEYGVDAFTTIPLSDPSSFSNPLSNASKSAPHREFLDSYSPSSVSSAFRERLVRLLQPLPTSVFPSEGSVSYTQDIGYPPRLSEAVLNGLTLSATTFQDECSLCYHLSNRSPYDTTSTLLLSQYPTLQTLSPSRCLATATCSILEPLCTQPKVRYPFRHWLQHAKQVLRVVPASQGVSASHSGGFNTNLYRKILFEQAAKFNADPKGIVPVEKALAAQWVHATATAVGVVRRSDNLEYLVNHPVRDDDPHFRRIRATPQSQCDSPPSETASPFISPSHRCLIGPSLRSLLQREVWKDYPECLSILRGVEDDKPIHSFDKYFTTSTVLEDLCPTPEQSMKRQMRKLQRLICVHPHKIRPLGPVLRLRGRYGHQILNAWTDGIEEMCRSIFTAADVLHPVVLAQHCLFPSTSALQDDCGKLVVLGDLLHRLKADGHKCIIFTQMSKMLDILEGFINLHSLTYVRLDGSTKIEQRQRVVESFNTDPRIFLFMSSTRAGGVGINLIGADTVIFYDTDWNPAMDRQAMDRCHRIGQTQDVHIYRLITEHTIEENILRKQLLKRMLDDVVVDKGRFTTQQITDFLDKTDVKEMFRCSVEASSDLYVTRVLHEQQLLTPAVTPATPTEAGAKAFESAIARIEDLDDQLALEQSSLEKSMELDAFEKEFEEDFLLTESANSTVEEQSIDNVLPLSIKTLVDTTTEIEPVQVEPVPMEPAPFWLRQRTITEPSEAAPIEDSIGIPSGIPQHQQSGRTRVSIDGQTSFYVTDIVKYAIGYTEKNLPQKIQNEVSLLQTRLDQFKAVHQQ